MYNFPYNFSHLLGLPRESQVTEYWLVELSTCFFLRRSRKIILGQVASAKFCHFQSASRPDVRDLGRHVTRSPGIPETLLSTLDFFCTLYEPLRGTRAGLPNSRATPAREDPHESCKIWTKSLPVSMCASLCVQKDHVTSFSSSPNQQRQRRGTTTVTGVGVRNVLFSAFSLSLLFPPVRPKRGYKTRESERE